MPTHRDYPWERDRRELERREGVVQPAFLPSAEDCGVSLGGPPPLSVGGQRKATSDRVAWSRPRLVVGSGEGWLVLFVILVGLGLTVAVIAVR